MEDNKITNEQNNNPNPPENPGVSPAGASQENGETLKELVKELADALRATAPAPQPAPAQSAPSEPTEAEKKAAEQAAKQAQKQRARKRRGRAFRALIFRFLMLVVIVYVLFFQIIGVTVMPNGDMYPRIDSGDLVVFYRLDKDVLAQDIVVFQKDAGAIQDRVDKVETEEEPSPTTAPRHGRTPTPTATPAPTVAPTQVPDIPPETLADDGTFMGRVSRWVYEGERWLGLRSPEGMQTFICRVVACEGDTVEITDEGQLRVNGNAMIETNIFSQTTTYEGFTEYPLTLGPGECFVLADQRNGGADSRFFGAVKKDEILGTVITIARRNNL